jgi:hypothetical protein
MNLNELKHRLTLSLCSMSSNECGFSVLLVCLVLSMTAALYAVTMISQSENALRVFKARYQEEIDLRNLVGEIGIILSDRTLCTQQLSSRAPGTPLTVSYPAVGSSPRRVLASASAPNNKYNRLAITSIQWSWVRDLSGNAKLANLTVRAQGRTNGVSLVNQIPMYVTLSGSGIQACATTANGAQPGSLLFDDMCVQGGFVRYDFETDKCI